MSKSKFNNKQTRPLVSVVIPCFNLGEYLDDAVSSVLSQTYSSWEIIISDDGSTDSKTKDVLKKIAKKYPTITMLSQENAGPSAARNKGIAHTKGKYIICLDADDKLAPTYIEKTVSVFEKDKDNELGFVTTWLQEFGLRDNLWQTKSYDVDELLLTNIAHAGSMFRKSAWEAIGGYKSGHIQGYEDWEFWITLAEYGYKWRSINEPLFFYRIRKNSLLSSAQELHLEKYNLLYELHKDLFNKHSKTLLIRSVSEINDLRHAINAKNTAIDDYEKSIEEYQKAVEYHKDESYKLSEKLQSLYSSRITLWALKLIKVSIFIRTKPGRLKLKTITFLKSLVPSPAKQVIRKIQRLLFPVKIIEIKNKKWDNSKPLVSIVTPFYNQGDFILETVESVLRQTYQDFEYIIVDDGSEDEHHKALESIIDRRVKIIRHKENIGEGSPAAARNDGIKHASGKYIVCLDSDDKLDPTFLEKGIIALETDPSASLVTTDTLTFGARTEEVVYPGYDPQALIEDNRVITAAMYKREGWEKIGGYKAGIGYEDWEFWINLAENGFFGRHIREKIFNYRVARESRYTEDKKKHSENLRSIRSLHPNYKKNIKRLQGSLKRKVFRADKNSAFINLDTASQYRKLDQGKRNVLVAVPWMTFGGAETLIVNFCNEIKETSNLSFVTGLESAHEWEAKFKAITPNVYHLTTLFGDDKELKIEFLCNYIETRKIELVHIIHTSFMFELLPEVKKRFPDLKIIITLFNDRAEHFELSVQNQKYIDSFSTDNNSVANHYKKRLEHGKPIKVIPNGINCYDIFNPDLFDRSRERVKLGIDEDDLAVYFIGRLSEEKNPDVYLRVAKNLSKVQNIKFFIIGDGPMRPQLEKTIKDTKLSNVQYLGYQSDIARYLSTADIFVLPSSIEGFPLSILEAMAMGVVSVASDVGAVSEVVSSGKDGFVVSPGSAKEIREVIEILNKDRELLNRVKSKARTAVEGKYSNKILGDNYNKLYEEL